MFNKITAWLDSFLWSYHWVGYEWLNVTKYVTWPYIIALDGNNNINIYWENHPLVHTRILTNAHVHAYVPCSYQTWFERIYMARCIAIFLKIVQVPRMTATLFFIITAFKQWRLILRRREDTERCCLRLHMPHTCWLGLSMTLGHGSIWSRLP